MWKRRPSVIEQEFDRLIRNTTKDQPARAPRGGAGRRLVQHEKFEQGDGIKLLRSIGATVYTVGTRRSRGTRCKKCGEFVPNPDQGTRQTPGIPDVLAFMRPHEMDLATQRPRRHLLWWEAKRPGGGEESDAQREFRALCSETATLHCLGDVNDLVAFLVAQGFLKRENVPYYRLPANLMTESAPCAGHATPLKGRSR